MSGTIFLEASELSVFEPDGLVNVAIVRTGDLSQDVTVEYQITLDTADIDDVGAGTLGIFTVVMSAGEDRVILPIEIIDDDLSEPTETIIFSLVSVDSGTLLFPRTTRIDILDDENPVVPPVNPPLISHYDVTEFDVFTGLSLPIAFEFSPIDQSLLYVAEKGGLITQRDVTTGATISTVIDLSDVVNSASDRGLLDIAIHPNFVANPYLYAFYVVDPPEVFDNSGNAGEDGAGNRFSHLVRFELDAATGYSTIVAGSETILLGAAGQSLSDISGGGELNFNETSTFGLMASEIDPATGEYKQDYLKVDSTSHAGGSVEFGPDGALYVSVGDGTSFNAADPRSVSVQDIGSLSGKILRVDPLTGDGLVDNPFVAAAGGDLTLNEAKVYQLGLRNPFSMSFDVNGKLFITNTGWSEYESIFNGDAGANFGWPYIEGGDNGQLEPAPGYQDFPEAQAFYDAIDNGSLEITPAYRAFSHASTDPGFQVQAITGSDDIINSGLLPDSLQGHYIFTDVVQGEVFSVSTDDRREVEFLYQSSGPYAPVHFKQGPDGYIYYADLILGTIGRLEIVEAELIGLTFHYGTKEYEVLGTAATWTEAQAAAIAADGTLLRIDDQAENDFLTSVLFRGQAIFIDASDAATEGTWVDSDGATIPYTNWANGQPDNNGNEDYARIWDTFGTWDDGQDNNTGFYEDGNYITDIDGLVVVERDKPLEFDGSTYQIIGSLDRWTDAQAAAIALGGTLLRIESQAENDYIMATFWNDQAIFVDANDVAIEGVWVDSDDNPLAHSNWRPGQPDNNEGIQHYARIADAQGRWDDGWDGSTAWHDGGGWVTDGTALAIVEFQSDDLVISGTTNPSVPENQTAVADYDANETISAWALSGADAAFFSIDANGTVSFDAAPDFESPADTGGNNVYDFVVEATDTAGNTATQAVAVTVTDVNEGGGSTYQIIGSLDRWTDAQAAAIALGGTLLRIESQAENDYIMATFWNDQAIFVDANDVAIEGVWVDSDDNPLAHSNWRPGQPDNNEGIQHYARIAYADGRWDDGWDGSTAWYDGVGWTGDTALAIVEFQSDDLVISGTTNPSVPENQTAVADYDANETISAWALSGADAAFFSIDANGTVSFDAAPDFESPADTGGNNVYDFVVEATDTAGNTATQAVAVTVTDVDEGGLVISGTTNPSVPENQTAVADYDANETISAWALSGADAAFFSIDANGTVSFDAAPDFESPADTGGNNVYDFVVEATDTAGNTATQAVAVTVTDVDEGGLVISGTTNPSVPENQTAVADYDANETISAWALSGADAAFFSIDANGTVSFDAAPDFESPADTGGNNVYDFVVEATDTAGNTATQAVAVTVTDVNEGGGSTYQIIGSLDRWTDAQAAAIALGGTLLRIESQAENDYIMATFWNDQAIFVDANDVAIEGVWVDSDDNPLAHSNWRPGQPDNNEGIQHYARIAYADGRWDDGWDGSTAWYDGVGWTGDTALAIVEFQSDDLVISGTTNPSVPENQTAVADYDANETISAWALSGADAAFFSIDANGTVSFDAAPDFESPADTGGNNVYDFVVEATDTAGNTATQAVAVTVTDVDEGGLVISGTTNPSVPENQTAVADYDANETISAWALSGADAAFFSIDANGTVSFDAAPDFESPADTGGNNVYDFVVEATDTAGNTATQAVAVTVTDVDEGGLVISGTTNPSVPENQTAVADYDANETISAWALSGADAAFFSIDANGTVSFDAAPDFESPADTGGNNVYDFVVEATDTAGNTATQAVAVTVTDVEFEFDGSTYQIIGSLDRWTDAQAAAIALGGTLLRIESQAENDYIMATFWSDQAIFVDANDVAIEGVWVDSDDNLLAHSNWRPGQPDNNEGIQHYARIAYADGRWDDGWDGSTAWYDGVGWTGDTALAIVEFADEFVFV